MAAGRALTIDIKTTDAQTLAALKRIQKELKDTGTTAQHTSKQGLSLGSALGGLAIGAGLKTAVGEFEEAEVTARKTAAAIEATGNAAGVSAREQEKLVTSLSKMAGVDDEVVAGGANMLRTFTAIKGEKFGETLAASMDVAAAKNIELSQASQMLGKALQDPFTGYVKLQKTMGPFSESAKAQIAAFQKVNDVAGAQGVILDELKGRFGGQAEAAATDSAKMKVAFGDAAESLGASLAPALTIAADGASKASSAFQAMPEPLQQIALAGGAAAIVGPKIAGGISAAATSFQALREAATSSGGGLRAVVSTAASSPLAWGAAAAGIGGLVWALSEMDSAAEKADAAASALAKTASDTGKTVEQVFREQLANSLAGVSGGLDALGDTTNVEASRKAIEELGIGADDLGDALLGSDAAYKDFTDSVALAREEQIATEKATGASSQEVASNARNYKVLVGELDLMRQQGLGAIETTGRLTKVQADLGVETNTTADAVDNLTGAMGGFLANSKEWSTANDAIASTGEAVNQAVIGVADAQDKVADAEQGVADAEQGVADANQAVADARRGVAEAEAAVGDALKGVETARRAVTDAEKDAVSAREDVTKATEDLAQAEADAKIDSDYMADALQGVTDAEERLALSQADSQAAQESLTEARANYGQTLRDLSDDAAGAADDVTLAEIAIRDAQARLAEVNADPKATADDRERAAIAIREAERRLHDAQERAAKAKAELERNQANGAEGSDAVVAAQDAVTAAAGRQEDAQRDLEDAVQTVADKQVEANGRVETAQDNLAAAIDRRSAADQRVIDAKDAVVTAQGAVQKATEGVWTANANVATAVDNVGAAQKRVTDAKDAVVTARDAVRKAERDVETAVKDQYKAYQDMAELMKPGSPYRERMEWLTEQMRQQYSYLPQNSSTGFTPIWKSAMGDKSGPGSGTGAAWDKGAPPSSPGTTPAARSDGWVQQPNGRWYHPRMPGEANYGDGYSDYGPTPHPGKPGSNVPGLPTPGAKSIEINVYGVNDPAATAEMIYRRAGWELTHLNGAA